MKWESGAPERPRSILIVEDESVVALLTRALLIRHGYVVEVVKTGEEAVARIAGSPGPAALPDLILMDIDLGAGVDGTVAAQQILSHVDVPILFHSSHTDAATVERTEGILSYGYVVKNSGDAVLLAALRMAFRTRDAARQAAEYARLLREVIDIVPSNIFAKDIEGRFLLANMGAARSYGRTPTELEGKFDTELGLSAEQLAAFRANNRAVFESGRPLTITQETVRVGVDGPRAFQTHIIPYTFPEWDKPAIIGVATDVTELKRQSEAARLNEDRFRRVAEETPGFIVEFAADGTLLYVNPALAALLDLAPEAFVGRKFTEFLPPDERETMNARIAVLQDVGAAAGRHGPAYVQRHQLPDGRIVDCEWRARGILNGAGELQSVFALGIDVTARRRAEERVAALLEEKQLILTEAHHRIKNNMNTIEALLSIQAQEHAGDPAGAALADAAGRIRTMMVLYDQLYRSNHATDLPARTYLEAVVGAALDPFSPFLAVRVEYAIADFDLHAPTLMPLGIIVQELVTNSAKHAFGSPQRAGELQRGTIRVAAHSDGTMAELSYADSGPGIPVAVADGSPKTFGLRLVHSLTRQLRGTLVVEPSGRFVLRFPR